MPHRKALQQQRDGQSNLTYAVHDCRSRTMTCMRMAVGKQPAAATWSCHLWWCPQLHVSQSGQWSPELPTVAPKVLKTQIRKLCHLAWAFSTFCLEHAASGPVAAKIFLQQAGNEEHRSLWTISCLTRSVSSSSPCYLSMVISGCGGVDLRAHSRIARQGLPTTCHSCFLRPVSNLHHLKEVLLSPAKSLPYVMDERWYLSSATLCHAIPAETWINGAFRRIKKEATCSWAGVLMWLLRGLETQFFITGKAFLNWMNFKYI